MINFPIAIDYNSHLMPYSAYNQNTTKAGAIGAIHARREKGELKVQIGFIGLGKMGGRIAHRLLMADHAVIGYNRTPEKATWLIAEGMRWGTTPRAIVVASDVIFAMVTNTAALRDIMDGEEGVTAALAPGKIFIDMSTVSVPVSRAFADQVASLGAQMLDCPVSGTVRQIDEGTISLMVGGELATFQQTLPILRDLATKITYVGKHGQGLVMKIALNLSLTTQFLGFAEGILLAEKQGIPRDIAVTAWCQSALASPMLQHRGPFVLGMPEDAWFDVTMMQKDLQLALELGQASDVPLLSVALANQLLNAARALGYGHEDFAILFEVLSQLSGLSSNSAAAPRQQTIQD